MANKCELLLNVVIGNMLKMLVSMTQKGRGQVRVLSIYPTRM